MANVVREYTVWKVKHLIVLMIVCPRLIWKDMDFIWYPKLYLHLRSVVGSLHSIIEQIRVKASRFKGVSVVYRFG